MKKFRPSQVFNPFENVPGEVHPCLHIDSINIGIGLYDYRLEAHDAAGNISYSDIKVVAAYDNGIRGEIYEGYARGSECYIDDSKIGNGSTGSGSGSTPGTGFGNGPSSSPKPMAYHCTLISWEYDTEYINSLLFFKIHRYDPNTDTANDTNTLSGTPTQTFRLIKSIRLLLSHFLLSHIFLLHRLLFNAFFLYFTYKNLLYLYCTLFFL